MFLDISSADDMFACIKDDKISGAFIDKLALLQGLLGEATTSQSSSGSSSKIATQASAVSTLDADVTEAAPTASASVTSAATLPPMPVPLPAAASSDSTSIEVPIFNSYLYGWENGMPAAMSVIFASGSQHVHDTQSLKDLESLYTTLNDDDNDDEIKDGAETSSSNNLPVASSSTSAATSTETPSNRLTTLAQQVAEAEARIRMEMAHPLSLAASSAKPGNGMSAAVQLWLTRRRHEDLQADGLCLICIEEDAGKADKNTCCTCCGSL